MPITHWICQACDGKEVSLSHFADTPCGELVHPDFCRAILMDRDSQYTTDSVRVSHGLGCPRRAAIEDSEGYAVDPLEANPAITGVAWHAMMEGAGGDGAEVEVSGNVMGVAIKGKIDRLRGPLIEDWKHVGDFQVKYLRDGGPKPEHVAQLSIYAELCEQSGKLRPERGIIWYHTSKRGKDALMPMGVELIGLADALSVRPHGGEYRVEELYRQADDYFSGRKQWQELPLAGQSMSFGAQTACNYCAVRKQCFVADRGSPF